MLFGGEAMMEDDEAEAELFIGVGVTGTGKGAARLVGLAKERKTALAFCFPVEERLVVAAAAAAAASSFSLSWAASASSSNFLRFGGLGLVESSASSCDLREEPLAPFLEAMVLAFALGGPQWAKRAALRAGARSSTRKRHCLPEARQFWQTGASGDKRQRTFLARQASQALTGRVRFLGSEAEADASDFLACAFVVVVEEEEAAGSWAGVDGPAEATDASVSAAAIMAEEAMLKGD